MFNNRIGERLLNKAVCLLLCSIALISISYFSLADNAEQTFDDWIINDCLDQKGGWTVTSSSVYGKSGAAVAMKTLEDSVSRLLIVAQKNNNGWEALLMNPGAVHNGYSDGDFFVVLDLEDTIILSYAGKHNSPHIQQYFNLKDGAWRFSSVISYYARPFESPSQSEITVIDEKGTWVGNGRVSSLSLLTDDDGNNLTQGDAIWLPDVLQSDELILSTWDNMDPPIVPYGLYRRSDGGDMDERYLKAIFKILFDSSYTYVDGIFTSGEYLQFIADTSDGTRVLLCGAFDMDSGWTFTQSTPLPEGTRFGIENFQDTLNLGGLGYGVGITRYADGTWGASHGLGQRFFTMGQTWANEGLPLWSGNPITIGDNPWSDITVIRDWTSVPKAYEAAASGFSVSGWATPNNPNPEDRLHLREKAGQNSASLGKYYNGTPVQVLHKGKEWTQVRIGNTKGYMMTEYLAFDENAQKVKTAFKSKAAAVLPVRIYWDDGSISLLNDSDVSQLVVIGLKDDNFLVWNPVDNRFGTIHKRELWDGNG